VPKRCTHFREDGSSCWEYCGMVKRKWWQFWIRPDMAWWLCSRCDIHMKSPVRWPEAR
jgi:hypothetical protein